MTVYHIDLIGFQPIAAVGSGFALQYDSCIDDKLPRDDAQCAVFVGEIIGAGDIISFFVHDFDGHGIGTFAYLRLLSGKAGFDLMALF